MEQEINIKKGDVFFATFEQFIGSEQKGDRPVVVLQNDVQNKYSPTTIVAPFTKVLKKSKAPTHIVIHKNDYLKYDSMILLEQTRVIDKSRLQKYIGSLNDFEIKLVNRALVNVFDVNIIDYLIKRLELGGNRYDNYTKKLFSDYYNKEIKN